VTTEPSRWRRLGRFAERHGAVVALAIVLLLATLRYRAFASPENLFNIGRQNSMLGLVALGMTFVIVSGGIDLSVGSLVAVAGLIAAALSWRGSALAVIGGVAGSTVLGLGNGLLVVRGRIQPFIATLATMIAGHGLALAITQEVSIPADRAATAFKWLGRGLLGPVPVPVVLLGLSYGLGALLLRHTRFGRHVYAIGDNEEAARLMGLAVGRVKLGVYACSGALSGLAGVLLASRLGAGQPTAGTGWELDAIAAVVVGGTLLSGGRGGAGATLIGVLLLGVLLNIFNLQGTVSSWWQLVLRGVFLLTVILVQRRLEGPGRAPTRSAPAH
jgi:ribose/xylose/arabinose/galactoside ABC-type transport system permease subunit